MRSTRRFKASCKSAFRAEKPKRLRFFDINQEVNIAILMSITSTIRTKDRGFSDAVFF